ncbi:hypothetical protein OsI_35760 [Oryza sativa Indica Group]|uniref:Uncharacterized protein n=1 Tax=Oryza sativa subsp. indica TaxID=39946 RepID=B8BK03_ORYSI|nr:hypothetical protein OsI_35760 [Oryza sativa Indica Group]
MEGRQRPHPPIHQICAKGKVVGGDAVASVMTAADQAEAMASAASTGDGGLSFARSNERGAVVAPTLFPPPDSASGKAAGSPPPDLGMAGFAVGLAAMISFVLNYQLTKTVTNV